MPAVTGIDHLYFAVSDLSRAETFYDTLLRDTPGFIKKPFTLNGDAHIQYLHQHFGTVLRPAREPGPHVRYAPGLHHFCLRVESIEDVHSVAAALNEKDIASAAHQHPEYAEDYWAVWVADPGGIALEITNYRAERRERHDAWEEIADATRS